MWLSIFHIHEAEEAFIKKYQWYFQYSQIKVYFIFKNILEIVINNQIIEGFIKATNKVHFWSVYDSLENATGKSKGEKENSNQIWI